MFELLRVVGNKHETSDSRVQIMISPADLSEQMHCGHTLVRGEAVQYNVTTCE